MRHRVVSFALLDGETRHVVGRALVCPSVRYASVAWRGASRPDRRFATPSEWVEIEASLAVGVPPTPLPMTSLWPQILIRDGRRESIALQYIDIRDVDFYAPEDALAALDALLRSVVA